MIRAASIPLPAGVRRAIVAHARREAPFECCGLLLGRRGSVDFAVPMRNLARSRVRFRLDDRAHIDVRRVIRAFEPRLAILGVYHSHPGGRAAPSAADIAEAFYPEWIHVIVGLTAGRARVRAFHLRNRRTKPAIPRPHR